MRIAYFDCFSGVSGDMCLGALVAAGYPAVRLIDLPRRIGLAGVRVTVAPARRGPFAATRVDVSVEAAQPHRRLLVQGPGIGAGQQADLLLERQPVDAGGQFALVHRLALYRALP